MTDNTQTEALLPSRETLMAQAQVFASAWAIAGSSFDPGDGMEVAEQEKAILADMTRRLHARIADLEAQPEAIGAGGVNGPLIGQPQAMPDLSALTERGAKAWAGVDARGLREGFTAADMATASAQGFRDGVASLAASAVGEPGASRAFLERALSAMEGVIDVADRNTTEFDALRSCVVDLTLMLFKPQACHPSPTSAEGVEHADQA